MLEVNKPLPSISFEATSNVKGSIADFKGKKVVLYFYPKDDTSGCTAESIDFRDNYSKFKALNTEIMGISRDSLTSHEKFKAKYELPFELISDPDEALCQLFDVMKEKSMYGRKYMGVERSTFVIDEQGLLIHEVRKVKVKGHVEQVLQLLAES